MDRYVTSISDCIDKSNNKIQEKKGTLLRIPSCLRGIASERGSVGIPPWSQKKWGVVSSHQACVHRRRCEHSLCKACIDSPPPRIKGDRWWETPCSRPLLIDMGDISCYYGWEKQYKRAAWRISNRRLSQGCNSRHPGNHRG